MTITVIEQSGKVLLIMNGPPWRLQFAPGRARHDAELLRSEAQQASCQGMRGLPLTCIGMPFEWRTISEAFVLSREIERHADLAEVDRPIIVRIAE